MEKLIQAAVNKDPMGFKAAAEKTLQSKLAAKLQEVKELLTTTK